MTLGIVAVQAYTGFGLASLLFQGVAGLITYATSTYIVPVEDDKPAVDNVVDRQGNLVVYRSKTH